MCGGGNPLSRRGIGGRSSLPRQALALHRGRRPAGSSGRPHLALSSSLGGRADGPGAFSSFPRKIRLTSRATFRIFPCPGGARARSFQRANPENNREHVPSRPPSRRPEKKLLTSKRNSRETGNPPLDGTGSLKTEQRRTREGGRKSSPHGDLRDSFEGLVRRDESGMSGRWLDVLSKTYFCTRPSGRVLRQVSNFFWRV